MYICVPGACHTTTTTTTMESTVKAKLKLPAQDELLEAFRHFDKRRDGRISGAELRAFFASLGEEMTEREAEAAIAELDSDGDGLLDFEDFVALMEGGKGGAFGGVGEEVEDGDLRKAFEMFEAVKGSGRITPRGLQGMLRRLGDETPLEACAKMIRAYDLDGDGELDFHEFAMMMS